MFYIFHGTDDFSAKEALTKLKNTLGDPDNLDLNTAELDGKSTSLGEIINNANALPFLAPHRLVIVHNYLSRFGGRAKSDTETMNKLVEALKNLPESTVLVFWDRETLKKSHPVLKFGTLHKNSVRAFNAPDKGALPRWIDQRVKQKNATIDFKAVQALASVVGDDLLNLDHEIEKLTLYVGTERAITLTDVELLCPYTADSETFAMANAIGRQDLRAALDQLHKRLEEGQNPLAILGSIGGQFRGLLEVKSMASAGLTPAQIAKEKGWRSDYAAKMRLKEANHFSLARLVQIFGILLETDIAIKTGEMEDILALDTLISRLCGINSQ